MASAVQTNIVLAVQNALAAAVVALLAILHLACVVLHISAQSIVTPFHRLAQRWGVIFPLLSHTLVLAVIMIALLALRLMDAFGLEALVTILTPLAPAMVVPIPQTNVIMVVE